MIFPYIQLQCHPLSLHKSSFLLIVGVWITSSMSSIFMLTGSPCFVCISQSLLYIHGDLRSEGNCRTDFDCVLAVFQHWWTCRAFQWSWASYLCRGMLSFIAWLVLRCVSQALMNAKFYILHAMHNTIRCVRCSISQSRKMTRMTSNTLAARIAHLTSTGQSHSVAYLLPIIIFILSPSW